MAEAWAKHLSKGWVRAESAGSHPLGKITDHTHTAMTERGISLDGQWSKGLADVSVEEMDVIVAMGYGVECTPPEGFKGRVVEWDVPDPYGHGIEAFRAVRDLIERRVRGLLWDSTQPAAPAN